jgi:hypothetical protein
MSYWRYRFPEKSLYLIEIDDVFMGHKSGLLFRGCDVFTYAHIILDVYYIVEKILFECERRGGLGEFRWEYIEEEGHQSTIHFTEVGRGFFTCRQLDLMASFSCRLICVSADGRVTCSIK